MWWRVGLGGAAAGYVQASSFTCTSCWDRHKFGVKKAYECALRRAKGARHDRCALWRLPFGRTYGLDSASSAHDRGRVPRYQSGAALAQWGS